MFDLTTKIILGLLLSALATSAGYSLYLRGEVSDRNTTISDQTTKLGENKLVIDRLVNNAKDNDALIEQFRKSLSDLKEASDKKSEQIAKALEEADRVSKTYETYSAQLLATIPKSSNMCKEADDLINSYLANERSGK